MGTRHLICVVKDNEYKVAQYGQWDGYPTGQGQTIVDFLVINGNIEKLENALLKVRYLDRDGKDKTLIEEYNKNAPTYMNDPETRTPDQIKWWSTYMTRDLGAGILNSIAYSEDSEIIINDNIDFAKDSLFCEWAYIINLDNNVLEIFKGFNQKPLNKTERFYSEEESKEYYPIKHYKTINISDLTIHSMNEIESEMEES